jgi:hypothetical protein
MKELLQNAIKQKDKLYSIKKLRICERCGIEYKAVSWNQRYCGSHRQHTGCSYIKHVEKMAEYDRQRRLKYPDGGRLRYKKWRDANPEKQKEIEKRRYEVIKKKRLSE